MREVIYVDVFLFENFFMNYLLLYILNRFCKCKAKWYKISLSALMGALYVFVLFFPELHIFYTVLMKIMVSMIMIVIAFTPYKLVDFLKMLFLLYIETFIFGGCILGMFYINSYDFEVQSGIIQISSVSPYYILFGSIVAILFVKLGFDFFQNYYSVKNKTINIKILMNGKECDVTALIDTGNSLKDPISQTPIIVVYIKAIINILPDELSKEIMSCINYDELAKKISHSSLKSRLRIIPYKALGTENGLLTGITVDGIIFKSQKGKEFVKEGIIALYNKPISSNGTYEAIAYPEIFKQGGIKC